MKFILQKIENEPVFQLQHDFVIEMENAIRYQQWRGQECESIYSTLEHLDLLKNNVEDISDYVPVGTIEFVKKFIDLYIKENGSKDLKPLNVPKNMFDFTYTGRHIDNFVINEQTRQDVFNIIDNWNYDKQVFIKSNDVIKSPLNNFYYKEDILDKSKLPNGNYQISEYINIQSEYRCFVYKGKLVGIQYYSGDFITFPDIVTISKIIVKLTTPENELTGFTFDVAIHEGKTILIEVHDFFSCGLYGFSDYNIIPYMFYRTFQKIKRNLL